MEKFSPYSIASRERHIEFNISKAHHAAAIHQEAREVKYFRHTSSQRQWKACFPSSNTVSCEKPCIQRSREDIVVKASSYYIFV